MLGRFALIALALVVFATPAKAERFFVRDQLEYAQALTELRAGDTVTLANGEWRNFEMVVSGKGRRNQPITIEPESPGGVVLTGQSNLRLGGEYLHVRGLVFRDGYSPTGDVVSFRVDAENLARNSRVSEIVIDSFSKPDRNETDYWVSIYGRNNRFDHSHLVGKTNRGVTLAVRLDAPENRENQHRIDHNYFGPRPVLGSNGGETLRIGTSHYAEYDSRTLVENNVFDRCDGEVEIISIKSGRNIVRGNLFLRSRGALTLRHGDGNLVERNIFLGHGEDHTGGIRVINRDQTVRDNYMEGLRGTGFASALTVMNGVPNSPANRYVQVSNATIEKNSILNSSRVSLGVGADEERSAVPVDSVMRNNLLQGIEGANPFQVDADISGIGMMGNVLIGDGQPGVLSLPAARRVALARAENGLLYPVDSGLQNVGAPRDLRVQSLDEVGVSWYDKPANAGPFGTGREIGVAASSLALRNAIAGAKDGDTLRLAPGRYHVDRILGIDKALTLAGPEGGQVRISFSRPTLFELREGGKLQLQNLVIDGSSAPDASGNAVIRTASTPIRGNVWIELKSVTVRNLMVNRDFDVIYLGPSTFADRIVIEKSVFEDISGTVVSAASEGDDQGRYNVEYLQIDECVFRNVAGPVAEIYRGGRDESTFGPHVRLRRSSLASSGSRPGVSLDLHGVQDAEIDENTFTGSAAIGITHTVGVPRSVIRCNAFNRTPAPLLKEQVHAGEPRVEMSDNRFEGQVSP